MMILWQLEVQLSFGAKFDVFYLSGSPLCMLRRITECIINTKKTYYIFICHILMEYSLLLLVVYVI